METGNIVLIVFLTAVGTCALTAQYWQSKYWELEARLNKEKFRVYQLEQQLKPQLSDEEAWKHYQYMHGIEMAKLNDQLDLHLEQWNEEERKMREKWAKEKKENKPGLIFD
jgi:hypothetical protein